MWLVFPLLCYFSVEVAHRRFDCVRLPVDNSKDGNKMWMMNLFSDSSIGVCWVQVDLTGGINLTAHHAIFIAIVKE